MERLHGGATVKHEVKPDDIALMQTQKGWWLKVGGDWYCILSTVGVPFNKRVGSQDNYAATKAPFYKPLVDILKEIPIESDSQ